MKKLEKNLLGKWSGIPKLQQIKIRFLCQNWLFIPTQHSILSGDACCLIPHRVIKLQSKVTLILTPPA